MERERLRVVRRTLIVLPIFTEDHILCFCARGPVFDLAKACRYFIKEGTVALVFRKSLFETLPPVIAMQLEGGRQALHQFYCSDSHLPDEEQHPVALDFIDLTTRGPIPMIKGDNSQFTKTCGSIISTVRCQPDIMMRPFSFLIILNPDTFCADIDSASNVQRMIDSMSRRNDKLMGVMYDPDMFLQNDPDHMEAFNGALLRIFSIPKMMQLPEKGNNIVRMNDVFLYRLRTWIDPLMKRAHLRPNKTPNPSIAVLPTGYALDVKRVNK